MLRIQATWFNTAGKCPPSGDSVFSPPNEGRHRSISSAGTHPMLPAPSVSSVLYTSLEAFDYRTGRGAKLSRLDYKVSPIAFMITRFVLESLLSAFSHNQAYPIVLHPKLRCTEQNKNGRWVLVVEARRPSPGGCSSVSTTHGHCQTCGDR